MFEGPVLWPAMAVKLKICSILKEKQYVVGNWALHIRVLEELLTAKLEDSAREEEEDKKVCLACWLPQVHFLDIYGISRDSRQTQVEWSLVSFWK